MLALMKEIEKIHMTYARARTHDTEQRNKAERRVDPEMTMVSGAGGGRPLRLVQPERGSQAARREKMLKAELKAMEKMEIAKLMKTCTVGSEVLDDSGDDSDDCDGAKGEMDVSHESAAGAAGAVIADVGVVRAGRGKAHKKNLKRQEQRRERLERERERVRECEARRAEHAAAEAEYASAQAEAALTIMLLLRAEPVGNTVSFADLREASMPQLKEKAEKAAVTIQAAARRWPRGSLQVSL